MYPLLQIESLVTITARDQVYVLAKLINEINFTMSDNSTLGDIPVEKYLDIPRAIDEKGKQRYDLFVFILRNKGDKEKFNVGQLVRLKT